MREPAISPLSPRNNQPVYRRHRRAIQPAPTSRKWVVSGVLAAISLFGVVSGNLPFGANAHADDGRMVSLYADGQKRIINTTASTVGQLLRRSNISLSPGDVVEPATVVRVPAGFFNINVYRARPVTVVDGYRSFRFVSASRSPVQLAQQAGLRVYPEDTFALSAVTDIVNSQAVGDRVAVKRAIAFTVKADGRVRHLRTQAPTVAKALAQAAIPLGLSDTLSVTAAAPVVPDMAIAIARVSEAMTDVTQVLPRPTQSVNDAMMPKGQTVVRSEGADGSKVTTMRIHYRDGAETSRDVVKVLSETAAQPRIVVNGTKVQFAGSVEYWRPMVIQEATKWNFDPSTMMRIMACESTGNATSISHFIVNGEHPMGLFQYLPSTWRAAGGTDENILDGPTQIQITAKKMATFGTGPWQCQ